MVSQLSLNDLKKLIKKRPFFEKNSVEIFEERVNHTNKKI